MNEIAKFNKQYLLAADVIVALSAEMGQLNDSEVDRWSNVESRKAHMEMIRQISDMAGPWDRDNVPERGMPIELRDHMYHLRANDFFGSDMTVILGAFTEAVDLLWEEDPTEGMTSEEKAEFQIYLDRKVEYEASQEGA